MRLTILECVYTEVKIINNMEKIISLSNNWQILQDVNHLGEKLEIYKPDFVDTDVFRLVSEWEKLPYLSHLQLVLSETPYFGRELRYFNHAPWWYKNEFYVSVDASKNATLNIQGADYYCKVWLNGEYLGEHEGYSSTFSFEIGNLLKHDDKNLLVLSVGSPWDDGSVVPSYEWRRVHRRLCGMFKGTYEHADTFIQRDVNPVGLWGGVSIVYHDGVTVTAPVTVMSEPEKDLINSAKVNIAMRINSDIDRELEINYGIYESVSGRRVSSWQESLNIAAGETCLNPTGLIDNPKLWEPWERGVPHLYELQITAYSRDIIYFKRNKKFGVRKAELLRTQEEIKFSINGRRMFLRGASYFPDMYVSAMSRERYRRDVINAKQAGINALRVHVHVCQQSFYEVCDELGMMVLQDSDFNWCHPTDDKFTERAVGVFSDMLKDLYCHPSIVCWIVMNEPQGPIEDPMYDFMHNAPGPQLMQALKNIDPHRPYIKGSCYEKDIDSGDTHDYTGCFDDNNYIKYDVSHQRLNTEFGMDSPPVKENLRRVRKLYDRVGCLEDKLPELHDYQYRLLKYVMEEFRLNRFSPCAGYVQFMFIDIGPQSFYGVYDWWGVPKNGLRAFEEANKPIAVIGRIKNDKLEITAVNDLENKLDGYVLEWTLTEDTGNIIIKGEKYLDIPADGIISLEPLTLTAELIASSVYKLSLILNDNNNMPAAVNIYDDVLNHPSHPDGHCLRMSHELGVRLFDA